MQPIQTKINSLLLDSSPFSSVQWNGHSFTHSSIPSCISYFIRSLRAIQFISVQVNPIQSPAQAIQFNSMQFGSGRSGSPISMRFNSSQLNSIQFFARSCMFIHCMPSLIQFHHVPPQRITLCQSSRNWWHEIAFSWYLFRVGPFPFMKLPPCLARVLLAEGKRERKRSVLRETMCKLVERDVA